MLRKHWMMLLALSVISVVGCGGTKESQEEPADPGPEAAVTEFLNAVRDGDDEKTEQMLTVTARQTTQSLDMNVAPAGSDTAEFEIGEVEYLADDGARVACTLSDLDQNRQRHTQELIWMLRREPNGWRIAGVAAMSGEGEAPKALNFESLEEMRMLHDASQQLPGQAQRPENSQGAIQR